MVVNSHSIEYLDPATIKLRERAWRKYPARQIAEAKRQLERTGTVVEPPLIDSDGCAVCGGAIIQAARQLGWTQIPVLVVANMTPEELRLYAINASDPSREEFAFGHGEMSPNEFTRFLTKAMRLMKEASEPGAWQAFYMSYHFLLELLRAGNIVFGRPKAMCTWIKSQPGQGTPFRSQTEHIVYFRKEDGPARDNVQLGKHGRSRSTAWHYDGMTTASSERSELLKSHATPKPVDMLQDAILDVTSYDGIVLDPFGGIGSSMLAAHAVERRGYAQSFEQLPAGRTEPLFKGLILLAADSTQRRRGLMRCVTEGRMDQIE